ncbi:MAG: carbon monoxide dehydrogenase [Rhodobacteraceae bacterium]|nr:carbon monoxide dehydrogenase [Paracoccaceae bacterium]
MELTDEILINAPRSIVYAALNDPEILRAAIPGCEELIKHSDTDLEAKVVLKIGPVKARFSGRVTLDPGRAPDHMSLSGEGSGGVAGFAKGGADVELIEQGTETLLRYTARADVGGKIAQLGSRLILGAARKLSASFFEAFAAELAKSEVT